MGGDGQLKDLRTNFDALQKSDAKIFGAVVLDFQVLECIQLWSDVINIQQLDRRDKLAAVPAKDRLEFEQTKLSQNTTENSWFFKSLADHVATSQQLQILHIVGLRLSRVGYQTLGHGIFRSTRIRRLLIQSCNLAQGDNLNSLTDGVYNKNSEDSEGLKDVKSLELIDFQCNDLQDRHTTPIIKMLCAQYSLKDVLRWKLGLRNKEKLNVQKLGIKCLLLSRNNLGDAFAEKLGLALLSDEYVKSICLKKNNIGCEGFRQLAEAVCQHEGIVSLDIRYNPCDELKECKKYRQAMTKKFFENIKNEVDHIKQFGNARIKIDWIYPDALGLKDNKLDEYHRHDLFPAQRRAYFSELIQEIADQLDMSWGQVLKAFFGNKFNSLIPLKNQLVKARRGSKKRSKSIHPRRV